MQLWPLFVRLRLLIVFSPQSYVSGFTSAQHLHCSKLLRRISRNPRVFLPPLAHCGIWTVTNCSIACDEKLGLVKCVRGVIWMSVGRGRGEPVVEAAAGQRHRCGSCWCVRGAMCRCYIYAMVTLDRALVIYVRRHRVTSLDRPTSTPDARNRHGITHTISPRSFDK